MIRVWVLSNHTRYIHDYRIVLLQYRKLEIRLA